VIRAAGVAYDCHGKQVTNNTILGEFSPMAQESIDSRMIVRIMPAEHPAGSERAFRARQTYMRNAKESDG
jgi:hypothetical protein